MTYGRAIGAFQAIVRGVIAHHRTNPAAGAQFRHYCVKTPPEHVDTSYNPKINREVFKAELKPVGKDEARLSMVITPEIQKMANSFGAMQGGTIATLHDLVASQAVRATGHTGIHSNLAVQFIAPVQLIRDDVVKGYAKIQKMGKSTAFVESTIEVERKDVSYAQHIFSLKPKD